MTKLEIFKDCLEEEFGAACLEFEDLPEKTPTLKVIWKPANLAQTITRRTINIGAVKAAAHVALLFRTEEWRREKDDGDHS